MKELKLKRKYFEECSSKTQVKAMGKGNFLKQKKKKKKKKTPRKNKAFPLYNFYVNLEIYISKCQQVFMDQIVFDLKIL